MCMGLRVKSLIAHYAAKLLRRGVQMTLVEEIVIIGNLQSC